MSTHADMETLEIPLFLLYHSHKPAQHSPLAHEFDMQILPDSLLLAGVWLRQIRLDYTKEILSFSLMRAGMSIPVSIRVALETFHNN